MFIIIIIIVIDKFNYKLKEKKMFQKISRLAAWNPEVNLSPQSDLEKQIFCY